MKQDKIKLLTRYLLNHDNWISSEKLVNILGVSPRTLRNYISEINAGSKEKVILSSKFGYRLNKNNFPLFNEDLQYSKDFPDLPSTRSLYWIRKLLMAPSIDEFEILEKLFTSDATVKRDLNKVSKITKFFNLSLVRRGDKLSILGEEFDIRRLGMFCTSTILDDTLFDFEALILSFKDFPIQIIREIIEDAIAQEPNIIINGYVFNVIFLYIGVAVTRLSNGYSMQDDLIDFDKEKFAAEYKIALEVQRKLADLLTFDIPESEVSGLAVVLASYLTSNCSNGAIDESLVSTLDKFHVQIISSDKLFYLTDYTSRISVRSQYGLPMLIPKYSLEYIKIEYWYYYQLANQILKDLAQKKSLRFLEEDIGSLVILLNDYCEHEKLKCLLITPKFYDISDSLFNKVVTFFSKDLEITRNQRLELSSVSKNFDLIITTFPIENIDNMVLISPIFGTQDKLKVMSKIQDIRSF